MRRLKSILMLLIILVLIFLLHGSSAASPTEGYGILLTGDYHGFEIQADSGEVWLALVEDNGKAYLKAAPIDIKHTYDAMLDKPGRRTGKAVSMPIPEKPIFLLKGVGLTEGPLETAFGGHNGFRGDKFVYPGESLSLKLENAYFSFRAFGEAIPPESREATIIRNYTLEYSVCMRAPTRYQSIVSWERVSMDSPPRILWAGDLNRDGFLDIIMDLGGHEGVLNITLFLSTPDGGSIEKVAAFQPAGC